MQSNTIETRLPCAALFLRVLAIDTDGSVTVCCFDANLLLETGNALVHGGSSMRALIEGRHVNALRLAHLMGRVSDIPLCEHCQNDCYGRADPRDVVVFGLTQASGTTLAEILRRNPYLRPYLGLHPASSADDGEEAPSPSLGCRGDDRPVVPPDNLVLDLFEGRNALQLTPRVRENLTWFERHVRAWTPAERTELTHRLAAEARTTAAPRQPTGGGPAGYIGAASDTWRWVLELDEAHLLSHVASVEPLVLPATEEDRAPHGSSGSPASGCEIVQFTPLTENDQRTYWIPPGRPLGFRTWVRAPEGVLAGGSGHPETVAIALVSPDGRDRWACIVPIGARDDEPRDILRVELRHVTGHPPGKFTITALVFDGARNLLCARSMPVPLHLSDERPPATLGAEDEPRAPIAGPPLSAFHHRLDVANFMVNLVGYCNLSCVMCAYTGAEHAKIPRKIARETLWRILSTAVADRVRIDLLMLSWKGEALLHPEFDAILDDLADVALEGLVSQYELVTNGEFLRRSTSDRILGHVAARRLAFYRVQISIDADDPDTYGAIRVGGRFETVERRVRYFIHRRAELGIDRPFLSVELIPQKLNIDRLEAFVRRWLDVFAEVGVAPHIAHEHAFDGDTIFLKPLAFFREGRGEDPEAWARETRRVVELFRE